MRWGTRLHDDFMLPHYVEQDFLNALEELSALGFRLDPAWFAPHLEFRFPQVGEVTVQDVALELRHALEPWHVLGEETAAGGTARYVDSSVERVQAHGARVGSRSGSLLACNGVAVPLSAHRARRASSSAGVRFKAWQPPSALHPTIAAQTPLVFDVYDRWSGRSLGGMTHHVAHPGGRSYETLPGERERGGGAAAGAVLSRSATRRARWPSRRWRWAGSIRARSTCGASRRAAHLARRMIFWSIWLSSG